MHIATFIAGTQNLPICDPFFPHPVAKCGELWGPRGGWGQKMEEVWISKGHVQTKNTHTELLHKQEIRLYCGLATDILEFICESG